MINIKEYDKLHEIILENKHLKVSILTLGAIIKSIKYLDREMILGYENNNDYFDDENYVGAIVGRYANRIENAEFELNGITYNLSPNENNNHHHGGFNSFNKRIWDYKIVDNNAVRLHLFSLDGDNGYPGNLEAYVTYQLIDNKLLVRFQASTDKKTIYGPTSHIYFNIDHEEDVKDTKLMINANKYLKTNEELIPTSIMDAIDEYDFTSIRSIKNDYDTTFILNDSNAAVLKKNDIQINIKTDYPALQIYTGKKVNGVIDGIAIEPEFYPNSPNVAEFPSPFLKAGELFEKQIEYEFLLTRKD